MLEIPNAVKTMRRQRNILRGAEDVDLIRYEYIPWVGFFTGSGSNQFERRDQKQGRLVIVIDQKGGP